MPLKPNGLLFLIVLPLFCWGQVSNNMTLHSQWNPGEIPNAGGVKFNDIWGYVDDNQNEYAIVGSAQFIHIVDVTDPENIVEIDRVAGGQSTIWRDFKTYGNRIYAVSDNTSEGLMIMDASFLPDSVHVTYQSTQFFAQCHNIFIDEPHGRLYVAGANTQNDGLIVLDISQDPDNPTQITTDQLPGEYVHDLYVNDHFVYASSGWNGLYIYDYTDPSQIKTLANISTNGYNHSSWLTDDYKYLIYAEEIPAGVDMGVIDLSNMLIGDIEIEKLFKFPLLAPNHTNVTPHNPYIRDTMLVVSYYLDGTQIFDIGDATDPQPYAHYDTRINMTYNVGGGNWGTYPYLPSGNIISSDMQNGLFVISMDDYDMSNIQYEPTFPSAVINEEESYNTCSGLPMQIVASGNYEHYFWFKDGLLIPNETDRSITANESGTYTAMGLQGQKLIESNTIEFERSEKPTIAIQNQQIDALPSSGSFEWLVNNQLIDQTGNSTTPTYSGYYQARRTDSNGCILTSDSIYFFVPQDLNISGLSGWNVQYQIGGNSIDVVLETSQLLRLNLSVYNALGQRMTHQIINSDGFQNVSIANQNWGTGIYFVTIENGKKQDSFKIYIP